MAEVVERVANLEGRVDAQSQELTRIHESVVRVEDKMDRGFESVGTMIARLEDNVERRFEAVDVAFARLEDKFEHWFAASDAALIQLEDKVGRRFETLETQVDAACQELRSDFRTDF